MSAVLQTFNLVKAFGGITATDDVTFSLEKGARHALIGPNGAGKTTFVNLLTGVLRPTSGRVSLMGQDITGLSREARVKRGVARTFQINQLFGTMTPLEMISLVTAERLGRGMRLFQRLDADGEAIAETADILARFKLEDIMDQRIATLPYGKQRQIEIAAAFAARPSVLLLDEPAAGVPEAERRELLETVAALPDDVSVLLIEHDMDIIFRFATRITVLVNGRVLTEGEPAVVARDPAVKQAYLGEAAHV
ncbi:ABC transporter ATP-binding protein [Bosea sp. BIWAKO-01]|uniref:ABC transporter ATP-binding protein n=1 Tax=Bosea sp. BIWAKO-01 TaxID=506668 RepID=UPI0008534311|nr:ABC transporter ATP-binding protein [Bosea sp. BIWAKO-01]GAU82738.1 branched-chain amino acid transport ATP-binding protein LivG [Bosea sp. BIWAKO-01]